jgi:hypothetical protein
MICYDPQNDLLRRAKISLLTTILTDTAATRTNDN